MKSVFDVATDLAKAHKAEDPETKAIYLAKSSESSSEVRLVEVSGSLGGGGEVLPFRFAPRNDLGVPYASVVVLLSFEDWAQPQVVRSRANWQSRRSGIMPSGLVPRCSTSSPSGRRPHMRSRPRAAGAALYPSVAEAANGVCVPVLGSVSPPPTETELF